MQRDFEADRLRWLQLDKAQQKEIIEAAFKGRPASSPELADIALGWSWVVLGPPWQRRRHPWHRYLIAFLLKASDRGPLYWNYMNGLEENDLIPIVRRAARAVERANWPDSLSRPDLSDQ